MDDRILSALGSFGMAGNACFHKSSATLKFIGIEGDKFSEIAFDKAGVKHRVDFRAT